MESKDENFLTKDIFLASFLITNSKKLIGLKPEGRVFWFVFSDKDSCEQITMKFWNGEGMVSARAFVDAYRNLKDMIFSQGRDQGQEKRGV